MTFTTVVLAWIFVAVLVFLALFFITVPYGRHARGGAWGPLLPDRWAWLIMELPAVVGLPLFAAFSGRPLSAPAAILTAVWTLHYVNRAFVYPFTMRRSDARTMPLGVVAMGLLFNLVNISLNGYALFIRPATNHVNAALIIGIAVFAAGMAINVQSDAILRRLRRQTTRGVPSGGLFGLVSCPNYLGEILEWGGWALGSGNLAGLSFFLWTIANLAPRAYAHHQWYRRTFPEYPPRRRALLPWVW